MKEDNHDMEPIETSTAREKEIHLLVGHTIIPGLNCYDYKTNMVSKNRTIVLQTLEAADYDLAISLVCDDILVMSIASSSSWLQIERTLECSDVQSMQTLECNTLASGHRDGQIRIWNVTSGECFRTINCFYDDGVRLLQLLESGQLAGVSHHGRVQVWNWHTARYLHTLQEQSNNNNHVVTLIQPLWAESHLVATSGSLDAGCGAIRLLYVDPTESIQDMQLVQQGFTSTASCDGKLLVASNSTIAVRDLNANEPNNRKEAERLENEKSASLVTSLRVLGGGKRAASGSQDHSISIWCLANYTLLFTLTGHKDRVSALEAIGDSQLASGSHDCTIMIWDLETRSCLHILEGHTGPVSSLRWLNLLNNAIDSTDEPQLVSGSFDRTMRIWCLPSVQPALQMAADDAIFRRQSYAPLHMLSESRLICASMDEKSIWIVDVTHKSHIQLGACASKITAVASAVKTRRTRLAVGFHDGTIQMWQMIGSSQCTKFDVPLGHTAQVTALEWLESGDRLASGSMDSTIMIWIVRNRNGHNSAVRLFTLAQTYCVCVYSYGIYALRAFGGSNRLVSSHHERGLVQVWHLDKYLTYYYPTADWQRNLGSHGGGKARITALEPLGEQRQLASGAEDGTICIWDLVDFKPVYSLPTSRVEAVAALRSLAGSGNRMASWSRHAPIQIWDLRSKECVHSFDPRAHLLAMTSSRVAAALAGDSRGTIRVWSVAETVETFECDLGGESDHHRVTHLHFLDANQLASASSSGAINIWHVSEKKLVHKLCILPPLTHMTSLGSKLYARFADSRIRVWDVCGAKVEMVQEVHDVVTQPADVVLLQAVSPHRFARVNSLHSQICVIENETGQSVLTLQGSWPRSDNPEKASISTIKYLSDDVLLVGHVDNTIRVLHLSQINDPTFDTSQINDQNLTQIVSKGASDAVLEVVGDQSEYLAVGQNKEIHIFLTNHSDNWLEYGELKGHTENVSAFQAFTHSRLASAAAGDSSVRVWHLATKRCVHVFDARPQMDIHCLHIFGKIKLFAIDSKQRNILGWAVPIYREGDFGDDVAIVRFHRHPVIALELLKSGTEVASGASDGSICLWNVSTGKLRLHVKCHTGLVFSLKALDMTRLASASLDNSIRIWNVSDGVDSQTVCLLVISSLPSYISYIKPFNENHIGCHFIDTSFRVFDYRTGECIKTVKFLRKESK